jgi:sterol 3beta-glucosyltransferase
MRIAVIAPGSRGDVQPYIALGNGLQQAGHLVSLVTHTDFQELVETHGLEFWPLKARVQDIAQGINLRAPLEGGNFLRILSQMSREAQRGALTLAKGGWAACQGMELLIAGIGGLFTGIALAEKLGVPLLQAYYIPFTPTEAYPSFLFPRLPFGPRAVWNRLSYHLVQQMMWQGFRVADKLARREVLDLPPAPFWGPYGAKCLQGTPILYGYSPAVIPRPADWPERVHVTGYWFLEEADAWTPPDALAEFLAAGPPPVYVGFGSMGSQKPEETARLIVQALARAGLRGILHTGWGGLQGVDLPQTVLMVDAVPFSWLFPQVAAVVHHGGAGTTSAGLSAGVPSVVVPFFGDQPFWGRKVAELGVGPAPIPRRKLTAERLAEAIQIAVDDEATRQRATDLGARIRAEDGVAAAVAVVEAMASGG